MLLTLLVDSAFADEPVPSEPVIQSDGTARTEVTLAADLASVRRIIDDPVAIGAMCPDVISARVLQHGPCDLVEVTTRGMTSPLKYLVKRCPTASGISETFVSSDDFSDVKVDWRLEAVAGGTRVSYSVRTSPDLPVPQRVITAMTGRSAVATLKNLVQRLTGQ